MILLSSLIEAHDGRSAAAGREMKANLSLAIKYAYLLAYYSQLEPSLA